MGKREKHACLWCNADLAMYGATFACRHARRQLWLIAKYYYLLLKGSYAVNISSYEDLLNAANAQAEPQRMLFVFTRAELPGEHTPNQQEQFKARQGGALTPVMCVDKLASARINFASLAEESRHTGKDWDIVFVACMSGRSADITESAEAEEPLKEMVKSIQVGSIGNYLAFNRAGEMVRLIAS